MKLKRVLSFVLVAALLLSSAPALQLAPRARAAVSEQNYLPLNYGGYSSVKDDGGLGGMNTPENMQTAQGAVDAGYFNRCTPNATWQIIAPEDGDYELRFWTFSETAVKGLVAVLVNDQTAVTDFMDSGNGNEMWSSLNFSVPLKKGMNIVRFLPRGGSTENLNWCDTAWMNADERLTVVEAKDSGVLTLNASDAHYITNWGDGTSDKLQNLYKFSGSASGIDAGNWNYSNFSKVPSYSYAIHAPADGYYDIKVGYGTGEDFLGSHWKIMVRVDDTNFTRAFDVDSTSSTVNASVYLTEGDHMITFSAANDNNSSYPGWYNPTNVTFYGGISLGEATRDPAIPTGRPDSVNTYVPEDGYLYTAGLESWDWGSTAYGLGGNNQGVPHTVDTIQAEGYLNKRDLPYAALVVDAPQDGTYYLYPKIEGNMAGIQMVASVNDAEYFTAGMVNTYTNCPYHHNDHNEGVFGDNSILELELTLKAGRNVIRLLPTAGPGYQDVYAQTQGAYMGIKRVCVDDRLSVVSVKDDTLNLKPGQANFVNKWNRNGDTVGGVEEGGTMDVANLNRGTLDNVPYFSFTLDVPADGYYDIDLSYGAELNDSYGACYIVVRVDDTNHICKFDFSTGNDGTMNASLYLTKGTHVVTFTRFARVSDNSMASWFDVHNVRVYGGVTLAETQLDPVVPQLTHNVAIQDNLSLRYSVDVTDYTYNEMWLDVTRNGKTVRLEPVLDGNYARFTYSNIAAAHIGDELTAVLHVVCGDREHIGAEDVYSVKQYAYNRLEKSDSASYKTLMVDLLNYAAAAQTYFGYDVEHLVNADLTEEQKALGTQEAPVLSSCYGMTALEGATAHFKAANVEFGNNANLWFYFTFDEVVDVENTVLKLTYTNIAGAEKTVEIPATEFRYDSAKGRYGVSCNAISLCDARCDISAVIYSGDTAISDTVTYDIETYAARRLAASEEASFIALLQAMMKFADAGKAHFSAK